MSAVNFSDTTPGAPSGGVNIKWQQDGSGNISAYAARVDIGGAPVSSVFGRMGDVIAQSGDYTAAQITNAVSTASSYTDPPWIASLNYSKITGAPAAPLLRSIFDFGAKGDGATDDSPAFVSAIAAGGAYIPAGHTYLVKQSLTVGSGVTFMGGGASAIVKRGAALTSGHGLFDITGSNVLFSNFAIDGAVTVAQGVNYTTLAAATPSYDPMQDVLSLNSSVWIHAGASLISFDGMLIQHTGGYAIAIDARTADIRDVLITNSAFLNNRPHLFGSDPADLNYGSWTGGIHYQADCSSGKPYAVRGLTVDNCTFRRGTGNQVWGHAYGYASTNSNVRVTNCVFTDIGRDCIEPLVTSGVVCSKNTGRRIGYICIDDTSASVPANLSGQNAVFIDGGAINFEFSDNTAISVNGGFFDLDSCFYGSVSDNSCRVPVSTDPEYAEDGIASWRISIWNGSVTTHTNGNFTYGASTSNNFNLNGGLNVSVIGNTFLNCGYEAIGMFAARNCNVTGNVIVHAATASEPPILIGNTNLSVGGGPVTQTDAVNNIITDNNISWSPSSPQAAIQESSTWSGSTVSWRPGEKNWVADNKLTTTTNIFEFSADVSSSSTTGTVISSQASGLAADASVSIKRERISGADVTSMYGPSGTLQWRFSDQTGEFSAPVLTAPVHSAPSGAALTLNTGGVARVTVTSAGNVGIGTAAPATQLDCNGLIRSIGTPTSWPSSGAGLEIAYSTAAAAGYVQAYDRTAAQWKTLNIGGSLIYLQGNVGCSNPAPAYPLDVTGAARISGNVECDGNLSQNLYWNGSGWVYRAAAAGFYTAFDGNGAYFNFAPAGAAGAAAASVKLMSFMSSGPMVYVNYPFGAGLPGPGVPQYENNLPSGSVLLTLTSNTQLTFRVRGADGVMRSGNVALA